MDFRTIRYFIEVADNHSLRIASDRLHIASSAISRKISMLEQALGVRLFDRTSAGMSLTTAGTVYRDYARRVMAETDRINVEMFAIKGVIRGHLRIAMLDGITADLGIRAWSRFHALHPDVTLEIQASGADRVIEAVVSRTVDVGVAANSQKVAGITTLGRLKAPVYAVMSPAIYQSFMGQAKIADITQRYSLALPDRTFVLRRQIDACAELARIRLSPELVTNSVEALREYARSGGGVTLLPQLAVSGDLRDGRLVGIPLAEPILRNSTIDIVVSKGDALSPSLKAYVNCIKDAAEDIASALRTTARPLRRSKPRRLKSAEASS
ncbi:MAG TPA: LysR family transcriptional regulator [Xanthobacteraceae bacterium]|nr:LysR family transcriptional regulator [Xanthobacteraceae bacterium]